VKGLRIYRKRNTKGRIKIESDIVLSAAGVISNEGIGLEDVGLPIEVKFGERMVQETNTRCAIGDITPGQHLLTWHPQKVLLRRKK
jgi:hypothetical protein